MSLLANFKRKARKYYEKSINLAPEFRRPYASHLPILYAISSLVNPKAILEYGSGFFSTCAFLKKEAFPFLTTVKSFENDRAWYEQLNDKLRQEERVNLEFVSGKICNAVNVADLQRADMIFIDDSVNLERAETIRAVAATKVAKIPIIIHDVHIRQYRWPTRLFQHRFVFNALNPQTGVVWNGDWPFASRLNTFNELISRHSNTLEPDDPAAWMSVFQGILQPPIKTHTSKQTA